jgi:regulator of protease activity HflC (stomatin/prohibitin superfamily)
MGDSLGNLAQVLAALAAIAGAAYLLFPRPVHVKDTHMGVMFNKGSHRILKPGWYLYWALWAEPRVYPVTRTTLDLPTQTLVTKDGQTILVSAVVVYFVEDIQKAIVDTYDFESDITNASRGAVKEVITESGMDALMEQNAVDKRLTSKVRSELRSFGVRVESVFLSDFAPCKVHRLVGDSPVV